MCIWRVRWLDVGIESEVVGVESEVVGCGYRE